MTLRGWLRSCVPGAPRNGDGEPGQSVVNQCDSHSCSVPWCLQFGPAYSMRGVITDVHYTLVWVSVQPEDRLFNFWCGPTRNRK